MTPATTADTSGLRGDRPGAGNVVFGNGGVKGNDPGMMVSPQMIVLSKISTVTVHTNIPVVSVDAGTVTLNGVAATSVWADDCGHLAVRFAVAKLALEPSNAVTLTMCGDYVNGPETGFVVQDVVKVK